MSRKQKENYFSTFISSLVLTIVIHFFVFSKIEMHSTLHVLIALILFWALMTVIGILRNRKYQI
jgi:hypothetical protein